MADAPANAALTTAPASKIPRPMAETSLPQLLSLPLAAFRPRASLLSSENSSTNAPPARIAPLLPGIYRTRWFRPVVLVVGNFNRSGRPAGAAAVGGGARRPAGRPGPLQDGLSPDGPFFLNSHRGFLMLPNAHFERLNCR